MFRAEYPLATCRARLCATALSVPAESLSFRPCEKCMWSSWSGRIFRHNASRALRDQTPHQSRPEGIHGYPVISPALKCHSSRTCLVPGIQEAGQVLYIYTHTRGGSHLRRSCTKRIVPASRTIRHHSIPAHVRGSLVRGGRARRELSSSLNRATVVQPRWRSRSTVRRQTGAREKKMLRGAVRTADASRGMLA